MLRKPSNVFRRTLSNRRGRKRRRSRSCLQDKHPGDDRRSRLPPANQLKSHGRSPAPIRPGVRPDARARSFRKTQALFFHIPGVNGERWGNRNTLPVTSFRIKIIRSAISCRPVFVYWPMRPQTMVNIPHLTATPWHVR